MAWRTIERSLRWSRDMGDGMPTASVEVLIKNPSSVELDFRARVALDWQVAHLKAHLAANYEGQPAVHLQRLIFCGQVLQDSTLLSTVFKNQDLSVSQNLHLVVKSPNDPPTPQASPNPSPSQQTFLRAAGVQRNNLRPVAAVPSSPNPAHTSDHQVGWSTPQVDSPYPQVSAGSTLNHQPTGARTSTSPPITPPALAVEAQMPSPTPETPLAFTNAAAPTATATNLAATHAMAMLNPVYAAAYQAALNVLSSSSGVPLSFTQTTPVLPALWTSSLAAFYQVPPGTLPLNMPPFPFNPPCHLVGGGGVPMYHPYTTHTPTVGQEASAVLNAAPTEAPVAGGVPPAMAAVLPPGVQIARVRVVRIDLVLVLKLVTVVMVLNQDGSHSRFLMLSAAAVLFYLHQTGVLRPLQDWLMPHIMERASMRRRPPAGYATPAGGNAQAGGDRETAVTESVGQERQREGPAVPAPEGTHMWRLGQEVRMLLIGFFTSLLPGFNPAVHIADGEAAGPALVAAVGDRDHQD